MTFPTVPLSGYVDAWNEKRKLPVKNCTNETIPGFAIMYIERVRYDANEFFAPEAERGKLIWRGTKPDALCEALQNPSLLIANGPQLIPPYGTGWGTQDWPAQVIHDGGSHRAVNGQMVGPAADSWLLWTGTAFVVHSHDAARGTWRNDYHTLIVAPGHRGPSNRFFGGIGSA